VGPNCQSHCRPIPASHWWKWPVEPVTMGATYKASRRHSNWTPQSRRSDKPPPARRLCCHRILGAALPIGAHCRAVLLPTELHFTSHLLPHRFLHSIITWLSSNCRSLAPPLHAPMNSTTSCRSSSSMRLHPRKPRDAAALRFLLPEQRSPAESQPLPLSYRWMTPITSATSRFFPVNHLSRPRVTPSR
jgi:hypothetical protein